MITSEKLLRPLYVGQLWQCDAEGCNRPASFKDAASDEAYCDEHTTLEDLDPTWPSNASLLNGIPVSRNAAFTWITKMSDLFTPREPNKHRGARGLWVSLPTSTKIRQNSADAKDVLADWIGSNLIYGSAGGLDKHYYIQVIFKGDLAYLHIKYQQILGTRFLGIVEAESVKEFFGVIEQ